MASTDGLFHDADDECEVLQGAAEELEDELADPGLSARAKKGIAARLRAVMRSMQNLGCNTASQ